MEIPEDLKYTDNDEWIRLDGDVATVGITDYAQDELSDVVYVEVIADIGESLEKGARFGAVESVKAAADVYMPVTGEVVEINEGLFETPELVNSSPYDEAWMIRIKVANPDDVDALRDSNNYADYIAERSQ